MAICERWAGKLYGTNTGDLYVTIEGDDDALTGKIRLNDPVFGLVVYAINGSFDGQKITLQGEPEQQIEGALLGTLSAEAILNSRGELEGDWSTDIGSAGTFVLFPHDRTVSPSADGSKQDVLHTARHDFGAVAVDRQQLIDLAEEVQEDFEQAKVIVTVLKGTEKSLALEDFKEAQFKEERAKVFKLYVRERQPSGVDRIAIVEFGPGVNYVMTQGSDEAWVLGMLEKLKNSVSPLERKYATNYKKFGFGLNQLILVGTVVYLPSLIDLRLRIALMIGVLAIIGAVNFASQRFLPLAALYLNERPKSLTSRTLPSAFSWFLAVTSAVVAALLAAYLQTWLPITH